MGVVLQESWLFSGTLRENLTLGYEDFTDDEVSKALEQSGAHFLGDNINEMLEFPILDRGQISRVDNVKSFALQELYYKNLQFYY